ncbi:hypothetical protein BO86DRAFT_187952 [Aspergillus japonicus CBS 114.51]|uniref:Uncharacterized protein n=1 Tax=Aspergillus japonicus CBS 114.51 TaxID=1448312 RepID=A0A8T8XB51_ASPJA|nr:hypothetical protein BO86DRAFT_187952 [Aspergillus japonicus CBS 114.51]RAH85295.1 hypothetical protein BO86DRAFT_187952 [Aspergillus japonicus CBS 114.51]
MEMGDGEEGEQSLCPWSGTTVAPTANKMKQRMKWIKQEEGGRLEERKGSRRRSRKIIKRVEDEQEGDSEREGGKRPREGDGE